MKTTDDIPFAKLLMTMSEYYQKTLPKSIIDMYWEALKNYSLAEIGTALQLHISNPMRGQYFPKIADIISLINEDNDKLVDEAWAQVAEKMSMGEYDSCDPIVCKTINNLGGTSRFQEVTTAQLRYLEREFKHEYKEVLDNAKLKQTKTMSLI